MADAAHGTVRKTCRSKKTAIRWHTSFIEEGYRTVTTTTDGDGSWTVKASHEGLKQRKERPMAETEKVRKTCHSAAEAKTWHDSFVEDGCTNVETKDNQNGTWTVTATCPKT